MRGDIASKRYRARGGFLGFGLSSQADRVLRAMTNYRFGGKLPPGYKVPQYALDLVTGQITRVV